MKAKTFFKNFIFVLLICFCITTFSACFFTVEPDSKSIVSIEKTSTNGLVDTYTITYTDNTTSTFTITNGKDGEDGINGANGKDGKDAEKISIYDIYNALIESGEFEGSFSAFLKAYLSYEQITSNKTSCINNALLSAVSIYSEFQIVTEEPIYTYHPIYGYIMSGTQEVKDTQIGAGAGIIFKLDKTTGDAYIVTNYHVVFNAESANANNIGKIHVYLYGSVVDVSYVIDEETDDYIYDSNGYPTVTYGENAISCEYVGGSMTYDLAVLKISGSNLLKNSDAKAVSIADDYHVGETAIAIGNPEAEGISVTEGIVSVDSEYFTMYGADEQTLVTFRTMRVDTAINSGNSGGGLFNEYGKLIGIVNAKIVDETIENIGYAIPRDIVVNVVENIIYNFEATNLKNVKKLTLGLTLTSNNSKAVWDNEYQISKIIEDIVVYDVDKDSLAESVGFVKGDIIKSIKINSKTYEGDNLNRMYNAIDLALTVRPNDSISYTVLRGEDIVTISFTASLTNFIIVE